MTSRSRTAGFSVVEVVAGLGIAIAVAAAGFTSYQAFLKKDKMDGLKTRVERELLSLTTHLFKVGRFAQNCTRASQTELRCTVDFNVPPTGPGTPVRFLLVDTDTDAKMDTVRYEVEAASVWQTKISYTGITRFEICSSSDMSGTPDACTSLGLLPSAISQRNLFRQPAAAGRESRFFRFRVGAQGAAGEERQIQSAFFVRNPGPGGLIYQWGEKK